MTVELSISLSDSQDRFVRDLVATGAYASVSAVVEQGLNLLWKEQESSDLRAAELRELINKRRAGQFLTEEESDAQIDAMLSASRTTYGVYRAF